jgi:hypothetical protein
MTMNSPQTKKIMNTTSRLIIRTGLLASSVLAVALTGCRTEMVHERTQTVYVPARVEQAPEPPAPEAYTPPAPDPSPVVVIQSENDFYEPLATYGRWVVIGSYGRVWVPARVESGWRPYSNGYWQRTDAGWYWTSEEPWGWATYHYGRWDFNPQYGWFWVPQTQWAPAWVAWREGGGYVGWAPLRPSVTIGVNVRVGDYEPAFASRAFVFVEHRRMLEPVRPKTVIVNNTTIINKTVNVTKVKVVNKTVINEGPQVEVVERESGHKVQPQPVREVRHREETSVAAREKNIPTRHDRKNEPLAGSERSVNETPTAPGIAHQAGTAPSRPQIEQPPRNDRQHDERPITSPVANHVETPSATQTQPIAIPTRPAPTRAETERPLREEKKQDIQNGTRVVTNPPVMDRGSAGAEPERNIQRVQPVGKPTVAAPNRNPVTANPQATEHRNQAGAQPDENILRHNGQPVEKPNTIASPKATPKRNPALTDRAETNRQSAIERRNTTTPTATANKKENNLTAAPGREVRTPAGVLPAPQTETNKQTTPRSGAANRLASPRQQSRRSGQAEMNGRQKEVSNITTNSDHQAIQPSATPRPQ